MAPTAAILLRAWESGAAAAPLDRAPSLLHSLGALATSVRTDELTVGQCDARLFELRRAMFGEMLEMVATCPACQTEVELTVALGELQPPVREGPVAPLTVQADGYTLLCRIPCNEDLQALARRDRRTVTLRDLLERCVIEASSPGGPPVAPRELPEATAEAIVEALAESDPGALYGAARALLLRQRVGRRTGHPRRGVERPDRMGRPDAHRGPPARADLRLVRGRDPGDERVAAALVPGGRGMVTPYLSRLRPVESGPLLRPRASFAVRARACAPDRQAGRSGASA